MTSTNPYYDWRAESRTITVGAVYRCPHREMSIAMKMWAAKESRREFLRRKKR